MNEPVAEKKPPSGQRPERVQVRLRRPPWIEAADGAAKWLGVVLLVVLGGAIGANWGPLNEFIKRALQDVSQLDVGEFRVTLAPDMEEHSTYGPSARWMDITRVQEHLRVTSVNLGGKRTGEYIVLRADAPVDLTGGYIGDAKHLLSLGDRDLNLKAGESVAIYTCLPESSASALAAGTPDQSPARRIIATKLDGTPGEKMFKNSLGAGDRIVVIGAGRHVVLDLDYWSTTDASNATPKRPSGKKKHHGDGSKH